MHEFDNVFNKSVGGVEQKDKGSSSDDNEDESNKGQMNGGKTNQKGKWDEDLEKDGSDLDNKSMNDMLTQVVSVEASSGLTGQKVYVSHSMLMKERSEQKKLII